MATQRRRGRRIFDIATAVGNPTFDSGVLLSGNSSTSIAPAVGAQRIAIAWTFARLTDPLPAAVTWGGNSFTALSPEIEYQVLPASFAVRGRLWYLLEDDFPASDSALTTTGLTTNGRKGLVQYTDVHPTTPFRGSGYTSLGWDPSETSPLSIPWNNPGSASSGDELAMGHYAGDANSDLKSIAATGYSHVTNSGTDTFASLLAQGTDPSSTWSGWSTSGTQRNIISLGVALRTGS